MSKNFIVYYNNIPQFRLTVNKNNTIKDVKTLIKKNLKQKMKEYNIRLFINPNTEVKIFNTSKYDKNSLKSIWKDMKDSQIFISKETGYQDLPKDMKKYLTEYLEPKQVLETCKEMVCDWGKLLNLHYDFVTQGFAVGNTPKEKYKYLAERVSKNVGVENPEIIFFHDNGRQFGDKKYYDISFNPDEDLEQDLQIIKNRLKTTKKNILHSFIKSNNVENIYEDDYNVWIKIKNRDLPIVYGTFTMYGDFYDLPNERIETLEKLNIKYPGKIEKLDKKSLIQYLKNNTDWGKLDDMELIDEMINYAEVAKYVNKMHNFSVYETMKNFKINRTEAEVITNIMSTWTGLTTCGDFLDDIEIYPKLVKWENGKVITYYANI